MATLLENICVDLPLSFGGGSVANGGQPSPGYAFEKMDDSEAEKLLSRAFEAGFRVFDSAPLYGHGLAEERIGRTFRKVREKVFLTSKSGIVQRPGGRIDYTNEPGVARKMLEQSLHSYGSDYIDLYMVHWPDERIDIRRPMEVLAKARVEGKIKHIGLCNTSLEDLDKAMEVAEVEVVQSRFNLLAPENGDLFPELQKRNISFMSWGTFERGILTGRVSKRRESAKDYHSGDCRRRAPWWKSSEILSRVEQFEKIRPLLEERGVSPVALALRHNLRRPGCTNCLVGVSSLGQLEEVLRAFRSPPDDELIDEAIALVHG